MIKESLSYSFENEDLKYRQYGLPESLLLKIYFSDFTNLDLGQLFFEVLDDHQPTRKWRKKQKDFG